MAEQTEKTYEVHTPSDTFNGTRYGVAFDGGTGRATKEQARFLTDALGYACPALGEDADAEADDDVSAGSPVDLVKGIGESTSGDLKKAGAETLGDLVEADAEALGAESGHGTDSIETWQAKAAALIEDGEA